MTKPEAADPKPVTRVERRLGWQAAAGPPFAAQNRMESCEGPPSAMRQKSFVWSRDLHQHSSRKQFASPLRGAFVCLCAVMA